MSMGAGGIGTVGVKSQESEENLQRRVPEVVASRERRGAAPAPGGRRTFAQENVQGEAETVIDDGEVLGVHNRQVLEFCLRCGDGDAAGGSGGFKDSEAKMMDTIDPCIKVVSESWEPSARGGKGGTMRSNKESLRKLYGLHGVPRASKTAYCRLRLRWAPPTPKEWRFQRQSTTAP